jgi:hypothetical protein
MGLTPNSTKLNESRDTFGCVDTSQITIEDEDEIN